MFRQSHLLVVARVVRPVDDVMRSSAQLNSGAVKLTNGSATATSSLAALPEAVNRPIKYGGPVQPPPT